MELPEAHASGPCVTETVHKGGVSAQVGVPEESGAELARGWIEQAAVAAERSEGQCPPFSS